MKSPSRLRSEIEFTESQIQGYRDKIKEKELQVSYHQLQAWRRTKKMLFSRLRKFESELEMSNQMTIFDEDKINE